MTTAYSNPISQRVMKVTEHIRSLLLGGKKRTELVELGFPKATVTKVWRVLREEKRNMSGIGVRGSSGNTRKKPQKRSNLEELAKRLGHTDAVAHHAEAVADYLWGPTICG